MRRVSKQAGFPPLLVFPEGDFRQFFFEFKQSIDIWRGFFAGTTANQEALITFKEGAFRPGLPVQPVAIRYPYKHFNHGLSGKAADDKGIFAHIYRVIELEVHHNLLEKLTGCFAQVLCQFSNRMEVIYLPVYKV